MKNTPVLSTIDPARRRWLQAMAAAPLVAGAAAPLPARAALKTNARIVIAGSGLGGIAVANRLAQLLDGAKITIVDRKEEHNYQPGYTLVATGVWPVAKVRDRNADFQPAGIEWVKDMVAGFDPVANTVVTAGGQRIPYDFLVVATGVHLDYAQIAGMDVAAIGREGLTSVYPSPEAAQATWAAMQTFTTKGGNAVMTLPATPLKCAGAPLKMTFMLRDRMAKAGTLGTSKISFESALGNVFGVKVVNDNVLERWKALGIDVAFSRKLTAIDIGARRATFSSPEGETQEMPYDFIHVVPPMRAPDAVKNSELAWKEGPFAAGGWLEVDKSTLQHRRFPNVFGIGDINGTPRGKTAATVKKSAPLVAHNLVEVIAGRQANENFDGYTSCPLITREGSAMLIEFDYEGRLTPTLPMIDPLQDSFFAWVMKVRMLKPAYMAVLKGRV
ncbi:MAG: FAD/NAD(P)-binding oxidoreductase [Hydrogenophaga sp.]|jgi:sulfide:quinone oxidoreductase|uniref:NAD(P)/FAD-dependent oxidoreductase n=1 Tax=Hydrogenophaga sp. TaxID=1904254 RepID=UPI0027313F4B|nr:FAD/NAD(P)-binding oxidoreductase [Hydrogenophaga sp.]MDP2251686.1 FAD/NAD(P)-binding oxidoreductase [Hydrogenophaga sp.]MDP3206233.1 FAD/NAD(P)-binding oxidoreductase [Hydrogenophaga sp.]MDP3350100.1 FAD/NAD(P)-binding oxidoreductase [Hydrogenophaga sp.]MDZ4128602.1 FAD/NAD(P)-binding oxidoreductase [Hydrogenophaga sp.]